MNDSNRHKKSDRIKWIITGVSLVLVFVFLVGLCMQLFGKGKIKPSEWIKTPNTDQLQPEVGTGDENDLTGGVSIGDSVSDGVVQGVTLKSDKIVAEDYEAYGVSAQAEMAYILTATAIPDSAPFTLNWAVGFQNPLSEWASGKIATDYVRITPTVDGGSTATAEYLKDFGEPIIVTVTVADAPQVSATCRLDYLQRVTDFDLKFGSVQCVWGGYTDFQFDCRSSQSPEGGLPELTLHSSAYTLDTSENQEVTYRLIHINDIIGNAGESAIIIESYSTGSTYYYLTMGLTNWVHGADISLFKNHDVAQKGLFFGYDWMYENLGLRYYSYPVNPSSGGITFKNYSLGEMKSMPYFSSLMSGSIPYFHLEVTVGGVTKQTTFRMTNYLAQ